MPTYEYRCPEGHDFEHFVLRMSEASSVMACPTCGVAAERRISAGGGLLFKGSGFYITDYGKDGKKDQRTRTAGAGESGTAFKEGAATKTEAESGGSGKSGDDKPAGSKSVSDKSGGDKSGGDKSGGDKSGGDKSSGDKSSGDKSSGGSKSTAAPKKQSAPKPSSSSGSSEQ